MKIERLIQIFEQLLPIYEKGYKEKYNNLQITFNHLQNGMCYAAEKNKIIVSWVDFYGIFCNNNAYYSNIRTDKHYLFPTPETWQDLKPRIDFMKSEIKELKRLLKKGYTHV